jgi:hypothetical protein
MRQQACKYLNRPGQGTNLLVNVELPEDLSGVQEVSVLKDPAPIMSATQVPEEVG